MSESPTECRPIFEDHIGLVKSIVSSFDRLCRAEDSEFFPIACMGLIKAISTFDPSKSKFSYWATKIIRNFILRELRKKKLEPTPMSRLDFEEGELEDRRHDAPLDLIPLVTKPSDQDSKTEAENKRMLVRHFLDGVSMAEMAREAGFTREGIRQKVKKAIESIRRRHSDLLDNHAFWLGTET